MMIAGLSLAAFQIGLHTTPVSENALDVARAMCFSVLAFSQLMHVFNVRSKQHSAFSNLFSNKMLLGAIAFSVGLMLCVLEIPYMHDLFRISHLTTMQWIYVAVLAIAPIPIVELVKLMVRLFRKAPSNA
jgi:Ca2+-transporting ATPase